MPLLTSAPVSARAPERHAQELLNEFLKSYFNGQPHRSPLGEVTFPACALFFNQTELTDPVEPQIHVVFTEFRPREHWFGGSDLTPWTETLAEPFSGIAYGFIEHGAMVEESVHGRSIRQLPGVAIRWMAGGANLLEQTFTDGEWQTVRTLAGASAIRWRRAAPNTGDYLEQVNIGGDWITVRSVTPINEIWDGTKILVEAKATFSFYVRTANQGSGQRGEHLCRKVSENLLELFQSDAPVELARRGIKHPRIISGPTPLSGAGFQVRLIVIGCQLRYFIPRQL